MSDTTSTANALSQKRLQQLRTKYRVERQFAEGELGVDNGATRDEIRDAILDATYWEREQLTYRTRRELRRLRRLMTEDASEFETADVALTDN